MLGIVLKCIVGAVTALAFIAGFGTYWRYGVLDVLVYGAGWALVPGIFLGLLFVRRFF